MKQATGKINPATADMCMPLCLEGHIFGKHRLKPSANGVGFVFTLVTRKSTLVPAEVFDEPLAAEYLAAAGLMCSEEECAVWSEPHDGMVAVMAIRHDVQEKLAENFNRPVFFTSPLLDGRHDGEGALALQIGNGAGYFRYADADGLQLAECVAIDTDDDVLYYTTQIFRHLNLSADTIIYIGRADDGDVSGAAALLQRYFKRVICEL